MLHSSYYIMEAKHKIRKGGGGKKDSVNTHDKIHDS